MKKKERDPFIWPPPGLPKPLRLTREEREVERMAERGELVPSSREEFEAVAAALKRLRERLKKDKVISIRVNGDDLARLKKKAKKRGIPYQSFISELIHRYSA